MCRCVIVLGIGTSVQHISETGRVQELPPVRMAHLPAVFSMFAFAWARTN